MSILEVESEIELRVRPCCPHCQAEMEKAVALIFAYALIPPLDPSLGSLIEVMDAQENLLVSLQEKCCRGGN